MIKIPYIKGNSAEQTYELHLIANKGFKIDEYKRGTNSQKNSYSLKLYRLFKVLPKITVSEIESSMEDVIGPFYRTGSYEGLIDKKQMKICPDCIKEGKLYFYQRLNCFDYCYEHSSPLKSECPECGGELKTDPYHASYVVRCTKCKSYYGYKGSPEDAVATSFKHRNDFDSYIFKKTPHSDINAWCLSTEELYGDVHNNKEPVEAKCFLKNYFLTGERGVPTFSIIKNDLVADETDYNSFTLTRLYKMATKKRDGSSGKEDSIEKSTHELLGAILTNKYYLMPRGTPADLYVSTLSRLEKVIGKEMTYMITTKVEERFYDRYFELLKPFVELFPDPWYKEFLPIYPYLKYTIIVFETDNQVDVYMFEYSDCNIDPNRITDDIMRRTSSRVKEYVINKLNL